MSELPTCPYCHKPVYPAEEQQTRKPYVAELLINLRVTFHVDCYQARLRWKQEEEL